jgi:deoxyribodipyrimidine photo-lyase
MSDSQNPAADPAPKPAIVWFRQDLRLADNPALIAAAKAGPVLAVFILDDHAPGAWKWGGASRWWLRHSLDRLGASLREHGVTLLFRRGPAPEILTELVDAVGAGSVFWNRLYEPFAVGRDTRIKAALTAKGVRTGSFAAGLIAEPWTLKTQGGGPFRVFTPFWKTLRGGVTPERPAGIPEFPHRMTAPGGERLEDWALLPEKPDWAGGLRESWTPGEDGARARLAAFLDEAAASYKDRRDIPGIEGVSRLSSHLHWGEISAREVWHAVENRVGPAGEPFLRELGWREFAHHLLWQFPELPEQPFNARFADFPWRRDAALLRRWQKGETGYPMVDAGMRQLWQTGWMHNRVRLIAASFLVKHLLIPWQDGEAWFWDTLVDADLANNAMNWQWIAGSGADAAPYFRIFNPVLQGEKFDPDGAYVRCFVPELARLPNEWLHKPWMAPSDILAEADVRLGENYPAPIVDHAAARDRALAALAEIRD